MQNQERKISQQLRRAMKIFETMKKRREQATEEFQRSDMLEIKILNEHENSEATPYSD